MINYSESSLRSIIKSFSWRVFGTVTTAAIAYFITGEFDIATKIGCIEFFLKMGVYYFHERLWNTLPYGKSKEKVNSSLLDI
jgi:uncharacterized membrane protein